MDSDLDIVLLVTDPGPYVGDEGWVEQAVGELAGVVRTKSWVPLTERRVRLAGGLEVEFGFAPLSWASTDPVDPGTSGVVGHGCQVVSDPDGLLGRLVEAVGRPRESGPVMS